MTKRQRVITAMNNKQPDRVPVFANLTPQIAKKLGNELNLPYEPVDSFIGTRVSHVEILNALGNDAVCVGALRAIPTVELDETTTQDEFGIVYESVGMYSQATKRPLADVNDIKKIENYIFPDPLADIRYDLAKEYISKYKDDYGIIGDAEMSLFELAWNLVGFEEFLMGMYTGEPYVEALLDKCLEFNMAVSLKLVDLGCDMIWLGDDVGAQNNMIMNPSLHKKLLKPRLAKVIQALKARNSDIKVAYHSCGAITEIIPDLIDAGVDILNPIQPLATGMDLGKLKKQYGKDLAFFGGVDVQDVLPVGSVQDVKDEVKLRIEQAGTNGGYILAPAHNIQPDTPVENVYAMFEAVNEYGKY